MANHVRFIQWEGINFAGLRSEIVKYGDVTKLSGKNGEGKSSIGTGPVWTLWGCDLFGKTHNPSPTNYEYDVVRAILTLSVDGEEMTFERGIDGGDTVYLVDGTPKSATKFKEAVAALFDKEDFLALYNPGFFFTQHWTKQREQILKYTVPPAKAEVFKEMSRTSPDQKTKDIGLNPAASKLDELTKKKSLDDLKDTFSKDKTQLEKQHIAAQSRTRTLQEQLDRLSDTGDNLEALRLEHAALLDRIKVIEQGTEAARETNRKRSFLSAQIEAVRTQVKAAADRYMLVYNEPIDDSCPACKRPLDDEAVKAVTDSKEKRKEQLRGEHAEIVAKRKQLEAELAALEPVDIDDEQLELQGLESNRRELEERIRISKERQRLQEEVAAAKQSEVDIHTRLKESIFILDAIKAYRAKEAEIQAGKVQSLFTSLSIRLFDYVKSSNEYTPAFSIQMDGKDYAALSVGEKITAGLELIEVLHKQSGLIAPTFIDGIGEYTGNIAVYDQVITARAVKGQRLKIETEVAVR